MQRLECAQNCPGNPDYCDLPLGSSSGYLDKHAGVQTVRSNSCPLLFSPTASARCQACGQYRKTLHASRKRVQGKPNETELSGSGAPSNHQEARGSNYEDLFKPGSVLRLLFDQQAKAAGLENSKGMRWHPWFIRMCLALRSKSPAAYRLLRDEWSLHLPSEKTLCSYLYFRDVPSGIDMGLLDELYSSGVTGDCTLLIDEMKMNDAINHTFKFIREVNKYLEITAPWKLLKKDINSAGKILYTAAESLRITALILSPIMPNRAQTVFDIFHIDSNEIEWGGLIAGTKIEVHKPLFPRIETNS